MVIIKSLGIFPTEDIIDVTRQAVATQQENQEIFKMKKVGDDPSLISFGLVQGNWVLRLIRKTGQSK